MSYILLAGWPMDYHACRSAGTPGNSVRHLCKRPLKGTFSGWENPESFAICDSDGINCCP